MKRTYFFKYVIKHWVVSQSGSSASQSKIEMRTRKMSLLPIIDVAVRDGGDVDQEFGFTLDKVCFGTKVGGGRRSGKVNEDDDDEEDEEEDEK